MQNLWGEEEVLLQPPHRLPKYEQTVKTSPPMCRFYGHTWQVVGMSYEKQCSVCGMKSYCPGCTAIGPKGAIILYCPKHNPQQESEGQP